MTKAKAPQQGDRFVYRYWSSSRQVACAIRKMCPSPLRHQLRRKHEYAAQVDLYLHSLNIAAQDAYIDLGDQPVWVPTPRDARRRHGGDSATYNRLVENGVILRRKLPPTEEFPFWHEYEPGQHGDGICMEFALPPHVLVDLMRLGVQSLLDGDQRVDLVSGKPLGRRLALREAKRQWSYDGTIALEPIPLPYDDICERALRCLAVAEGAGCKALRARALRGVVQVLRLPMALGFTRAKDGSVT